jgi:hypothetical protein
MENPERKAIEHIFSSLCYSAKNKVISYDGPFVLRYMKKGKSPKVKTPSTL